MSFTLFISNKCMHSKNLMTLLQEKKCTDFAIIDVDTEEYPEWLPGVPTIVKATNVYCGDAAFNYVSSLDITQEPKKRMETKLAPRRIPEISQKDPPRHLRPSSTSMSTSTPTTTSQSMSQIKNKKSVSGNSLQNAFKAPSTVEKDDSVYSQNIDKKVADMLASRR